MKNYKIENSFDFDFVDTTSGSQKERLEDVIFSSSFKFLCKVYCGLQISENSSRVSSKNLWQDSEKITKVSLKMALTLFQEKNSILLLRRPKI